MSSLRRMAKSQNKDDRIPKEACQFDSFQYVEKKRMGLVIPNDIQYRDLLVGIIESLESVGADGRTTRFFAWGTEDKELELLLFRIDNFVVDAANIFHFFETNYLVPNGLTANDCLVKCVEASTPNAYDRPHLLVASCSQELSDLVKKCTRDFAKANGINENDVLKNESCWAIEGLGADITAEPAIFNRQLPAYPFIPDDLLEVNERRVKLIYDDALPSAREDDQGNLSMTDSAPRPSYATRRGRGRGTDNNNPGRGQRGQHWNRGARGSWNPRGQGQGQGQPRGSGGRGSRGQPGQRGRGGGQHVARKPLLTLTIPRPPRELHHQTFQANLVRLYVAINLAKRSKVTKSITKSSTEYKIISLFSDPQQVSLDPDRLLQTAYGQHGPDVRSAPDANNPELMTKASFNYSNLPVPENKTDFTYANFKTYN